MLSSILKITKVLNRNIFLRSSVFNKLYTKEHEWVSVNEKQESATIGISNHAQGLLGDIVYIELPDVNQDLKQGEQCGALESVKAASEIFSPITGKVIQKNEEVELKPTLVNKSCLEKGWLFKMTINSPHELKSLMNEDAYQSFLKLKK